VDIARSKGKITSTSRIPSSWEVVDSQNPDSQPSPSPTTSSFKRKKGARFRKTSLSLFPPPTRYPKPKAISVPTSNPVFDYMPKFMVPLIEKVVDVIGEGHIGFRAIAEFMGLTEESHIMIRHNLIKELKEHRDDYVRVYAGEGRYNYILNGLHPPANMKGCAHLVDKWFTIPDMGHIVANYYKRCVVVLTTLGKSKSFFPLRGPPPPAKKTTPIMCLGLILNHFVHIFLKDACPLPPSSTEWHNHKNEEALTWEDEYLDQQDLFQKLMIIEEGKKPPQPKKESNKAEPFLLDTPEKPKQQFEVTAEDEGNYISLDLPQSLCD